jgi:hypothetical protein
MRSVLAGLLSLGFCATASATAEFKASLKHCTSPRWDTWLSGENGAVAPADISLGAASVVIK